MDIAERISKLEQYKDTLLKWQATREEKLRSFINQNTVWVKREVIEADCYHSLTIGPPPAVGGLVMRNVDPFAMMFDPPYRMNLVRNVVDMIDQTIGVLQAGPIEKPPDQPNVEIDLDVQRGYAFIAMPMDEDDLNLVDVLDAMKEAAARCGIHAERVDEPQSNERITDRILESIRKAEYVIAERVLRSGVRPRVEENAYLRRSARHKPGVRLEGLSRHILQEHERAQRLP
jgi:hypothetical protein